MEPVKRDMELLSNSMATYAHIKDEKIPLSCLYTKYEAIASNHKDCKRGKLLASANPESFALYFMMGVCFGLLMALCLLVTGIACRTRRRSRPPPSPERRQLKESSEEEEDEEDESVAEEARIPKVSDRSSHSNGTLRSVNVFTSAEELEKARRLEERERIVREIWRNGQPDILVTGTGTIGRVHYH